MSYLNPLRLHFSGRFQANVSTVNNDPEHFDNAAFEPDYQKLQTATSANGWFNPEGDASWRFLGCAITAAWMPAGAVGALDPVLAASVADSNGRVCAKLADLDSMQQMVSQIWGLQVRIADASGATLMSGAYQPAAFMDIWQRATGRGVGGDNAAGAMYQSVLTDLVWGDVSASPFLLALQAASADSGRLSIKFNVDGINLNFQSPDFMCGRLVGTIGPAAPGEPAHLVLGRQFMSQNANPSGFPVPTNGINFFAGKVDAGAGCIFLDLGNALSTLAPGQAMTDLGPLTLKVPDPLATPGNPAGTLISLGTIAATGVGGYAADPLWYGRTAGVVAIPLDPVQLALIATQPLFLVGEGTVAPALICEAPNGAFVRADAYVFRLSPGDVAQVPVYATLWGEPLPEIDISFASDSSQLQPGADLEVAVPLSALPFNASARTNTNGMALLTLTPGDPGTPRWFNGGLDYGIDGQVYGIRPTFTALAPELLPNQWNFISVLLWSGFVPARPLTWDAIAPILQQYANLYPVMGRFLDLGDYAAVVKHADLLKLAFGLDPSNPNAMPVTRDLSTAKRDAILAWLTNPLPGVAVSVKRAPDVLRAPAPETATPAPLPSKGGKAEAMARRTVMR